MWDWGNETSYMHDEITTSKQNPRMNANGPVYAVDAAHGKWSYLDPNENTTDQVDPDPDPRRSEDDAVALPAERRCGRRTSGVKRSCTPASSDPHNPMMDNKGRLWATTTVSQTAARLVQGRVS